MSGNDTNLPRATADEIAQPLAFALQFNRRKRDHSTEESSIWMSAVEAIHWAARGELGLLDFFACEAGAVRPDDLERASVTVTRAVRDERLSAYGHRTIDGRTDPSAVAKKLDSTLFLGRRVICCDGCVRDVF